VRKGERAPSNLRIETVRADGTHRHVLARHVQVVGRLVWTADAKRILAALY